MRFAFDSRKTAQAAAHLIHLNGGSLNYMVLIKLLYLADRQSLIETGMPITGDKMVAMPHGPVLSRTYDEINMGESIIPQLSSAWYKYVTEPQDYIVKNKQAAEDDQLSAYELQLLASVYNKFGGMNKWALRDYTHELPEWTDPNGSSHPIEPETILRACGKSDEEIEQLCADAEDVYFIRNLDKMVR